MIQNCADVTYVIAVDVAHVTDVSVVFALWMCVAAVGVVTTNACFVHAPCVNDAVVFNC